MRRRPARPRAGDPTDRMAPMAPKEFSGRRPRGRWWVQSDPASPGVPFGLLLLGAVLAAGALAAAAGRLAIAAHIDLWPGLGLTGLRCLLIPTRADLGAHALSYLFAAVLLASVGWTGTALVEQLRGTRRLAGAVAGSRTERPPRPLRRLLKRLGLDGRADVVVNAEPFAFCYGLLRPRVCASLGLIEHLGPPEVEAVLRHERYHLAQRDPLKLAVGRALAGALFFLPLVAELLRRYELARELAADRRVVVEMGEARPLAAALYRLVSQARRGAVVDGVGDWPTAQGLAGAPLAGVGLWLPGWRPAARGGPAASATAWSTLDARIEHLLNDVPPDPPPLSRRAAAQSLASIAAAAAPLFAPAQSRAAAAILAEAHLVPGLC